MMILDDGQVSRAYPMDEYAKLLQAIAGFAWPVLIFFGLWHFRVQIDSAFQLLKQQIASGAAIKWREFEFKGLDITSFDTKDGRDYRQENVDQAVFERRHDNYARNKNLFLVHRVRPAGEAHQVTQLPTFDVSVYLLSHKNFGRLNDVKRVEYYFGQHFGLRQNDFGTKFVVENGTDGFAVRVNAYGPMLCEAHVVFHDGTETTMGRYLDFEGTNYRFRSECPYANIARHLSLLFAPA